EKERRDGRRARRSCRHSGCADLLHTHPCQKAPSSSAIATKPLDQLPRQWVLEAEQLLDAGAEALRAWVEEPGALTALRLQGLEPGDVLAAGRERAAARWLGGAQGRVK
ncbi:unnamed protein product, partial [Prorocentrum cordatum]